MSNLLNEAIEQREVLARRLDQVKAENAALRHELASVTKHMGHIEALYLRALNLTISTAETVRLHDGIWIVTTTGYAINASDMGLEEGEELSSFAWDLPTGSMSSMLVRRDAEWTPCVEWGTLIAWTLTAFGKTYTVFNR